MNGHSDENVLQPAPLREELCRIQRLAESDEMDSQIEAVKRCSGAALREWCVPVLNQLASASPHDEVRIRGRAKLNAWGLAAEEAAMAASENTSTQARTQTRPTIIHPTKTVTGTETGTGTGGSVTIPPTLMRRMPSETWARVSDLLYSGDQRLTFDALTLMSPYSYEPVVRAQLRQMTDSEVPEIRGVVRAILRRQRSVDLGLSVFCACCTHLDPTDTDLEQRTLHRGIPELPTRFPLIGEYVWPNLDSCPRYHAASRDVIRTASRRRG